MKIIFDEIITAKPSIEIVWGNGSPNQLINKDQFEAAKSTGYEIPKGVSDLNGIHIQDFDSGKFTLNVSEDQIETKTVEAIKNKVGGGTYTDEMGGTYAFASDASTCEMGWSSGSTTFALAITSKDVTMTYKSGAEYPYSGPMTYNFGNDLFNNPVITLTRKDENDSPYYPPKIVLKVTDSKVEGPAKGPKTKKA